MGVRIRERKIGISMGTMGPEIPFIATEQSNRQQPQPPQIEPPVPQSATVNNSIRTLIKQSCLRIGDEVACHSCSKCNAPFEEFSEDELGLCIVIILVHREPALAATMFPEILRCNTKYVFYFLLRNLLTENNFQPTDGREVQRIPGKWVAICTCPMKSRLLANFSDAFCIS